MKFVFGMCDPPNKTFSLSPIYIVQYLMICCFVFLIPIIIIRFSISYKKIYFKLSVLVVFVRLYKRTLGQNKSYCYVNCMAIQILFLEISYSQCNVW